MPPTFANEPGYRFRALGDIAIVFGATAAGYAIELAAADYLPWGEAARGVIAVIAGAAVTLGVTLSRGGGLGDLGFRRPRRWATVPLWVTGILAAYIAAQALAPVLIAPFFELPEPDLSRYDAIRGNLPAAIAAALILPLTASIPEEIVYRGFLIERLMRLFGSARSSALPALLVQALIFGSVHFQWGAGGMIVTSIMGLIWGGAFLLCNRNLWILIIAHSTGHVALVAQLYFSPLPS